MTPQGRAAARDLRAGNLWNAAAARGYAVDMVAVLEAQAANPGDNMGAQLRKALNRGRVYPQINIAGAITGRMSVTGPALQSLSASYRRAMLADPGHALVGCDLTHVEPSIAAAMSGDEALIAGVQRGQDPYMELAEHLGVDDRNTAKRCFLAPLYGQGTTSFAEGLGITLTDAQILLHQADLKYPRLAEWRREVYNLAAAREPLLRIDGTPAAAPIDRKNGDQWAPRLAVNYLVQGSGAILLKLFTITVDKALSEAGMPGSLWLPIHDEIAIQVPTERAEEAAHLLETAMQCALGPVPIFGEAEIHGSRFGK